MHDLSKCYLSPPKFQLESCQIFVHLSRGHLATTLLITSFIIQLYESVNIFMLVIKNYTVITHRRIWSQSKFYQQRSLYCEITGKKIQLCWRLIYPSISFIGTQKFHSNYKNDVPNSNESHSYDQNFRDLKSNSNSFSYLSNFNYINHNFIPFILYLFKFNFFFIHQIHIKGYYQIFTGLHIKLMNVKCNIISFDLILLY